MVFDRRYLMWAYRVFISMVIDKNRWISETLNTFLFLMWNHLSNLSDYLIKSCLLLQNINTANAHKAHQGLFHAWFLQYHWHIFGHLNNTSDTYSQFNSSKFITYGKNYMSKHMANIAFIKCWWWLRIFVTWKQITEYLRLSKFVAMKV